MNSVLLKRSCLNSLGVVSFLGASLMASTASAFDYRASYVNVVASEGSGCQNLVRASLTDSGKSILLTLDSMTALAGSGADLADSLAACEIKLNVGLPDGVQYTLKGFETLASLSIERGGSATLQVRYGFPGTRQGLASLSFQGAVDRDLLLRRDYSYLNQFFSTCYSRRPVTVSVKLATKSDSQLRAISDVTLLQRQGHTLKLPLLIQECEQ